MLRGLMTLLTGSRVSVQDKEEVIAFYNKSSQIAALQDREAERYNAVVLQHASHLDSHESVEALVGASHRLALCAKELIRRHIRVGPVPDLAALSYAAWHVVYLAYDQWANATHEAFVAISEGRLVFGPERIQRFFLEMEKKRRVAEREDKKMLRAEGLRPSDLPRLIGGAYEGAEDSATVLFCKC
jgi:hypothetical protein